MYYLLLIEGLPLLGHLPNPSVPLWTFCAIWKLKNATSFHLCTLAAVVQVFLMEFSPTDQETSSWFIVLCPSFDSLRLSCEKKHTMASESWNHSYIHPRYYVIWWHNQNVYPTHNSQKSLSSVTFLTHLVSWRFSFWSVIYL